MLNFYESIIILNEKNTKKNVTHGLFYRQKNFMYLNLHSFFLTIFKFHFRFNINKFAQILLTQARVRGLYRANLVHH